MKEKILLLGILALSVFFISGCNKAAGNAVLSEGHKNTAEHLAEHELTESLLKQAGQTSEKAVPDNARMLTLKIEGMSCPSCSAGQASIYEQLDGVIEAKILYKKGMGKVVYDPAKIMPEDILKSATYPSTILKDEKFKT